ncbi:transglycosylase SLT domain-containing protein [Pigmentiphaga soli]|uniref:Transglycosylase SLT domain-containing protein n=1 Tax=Pigmentiphaga soli TaxID=1007095 RepID=A0ABP8GRS7_9BURK
MQSRPRGVLFTRGGLRDGILILAPFKFLAAAAALALAGCAAVAPPQADGGSMHASAKPVLERPAALSAERATLPSIDSFAGYGQAAASDDGMRLDAPLARHTSRPGLAPLVVDLTVQPTDIWSRLRRSFAIPNIDTPLVKEWEAYYAARPDYLQRSAERASKYLYYIIEEIDQRGLPSELALLPFVESSYDPWALSSAKASGLWQFIPATGHNYNLKQDWWRDERRDPIASTNAALDYLQYLFDFHGDWQLALASYNWGEGSVKRAIEKNEAQNLPTDYLSLDMPDETRNYIPKLQAIKNIISNPTAFGLTLPPIDNQPYFVTVTKSRTMDVKTAAQLAEMPLDEFKALNPSYNRGVIIGGDEPTLILPADRVAVFEANLQAHSGSLSSWHHHTVARGETLATVARKYKTSIATLRKANNLGPRSKVLAGAVLVVPVGGAAEAAVIASGPANPVRSAVARAPAPRLSARTYKVRRGDTLSSIARKYGTTVAQLRALNHLKSSALSIGRTLQIPGTGVSG